MVGPCLDGFGLVWFVSLVVGFFGPYGALFFLFSRLVEVVCFLSIRGTMALLVMSSEMANLMGLVSMS